MWKETESYFPLQLQRFEITKRSISLFLFLEIFCEMKNLKVVELNSNRIRALPSSIRNPNKLEYLLMDNNHDLEVNDELSPNINLKVMSLDGCYVKEVRIIIGKKRF